MSTLRCPALASKRTTGRESVGATFQLGGKLGIGRSGGMWKAILISLTSEERRTRPHMSLILMSRCRRPKGGTAGRRLDFRWLTCSSFVLYVRSSENDKPDRAP